MALESIEVKTAGRTLIFVESRDQRFAVIRAALIKAGAMEMTQQFFVLKLAKQAVIELLGTLAEHFAQGDVVSLVCEEDGRLKTFMIVPPKLA